MTRKYSKTNCVHGGKTPKVKRWKEPENEPFRSLEELNQEFARQKGAAFRSLGDLTNQFQQQQNRQQVNEVRYDLELDSLTGRLRAKSAEAIWDTQFTEEGRSNRDDASIEVGLSSPSRFSTYSRDVMLALFKAIVARPPSFDNVERLRISTVPLPPSRRSRDQEDPHLDDEHLIAKLEERLDKECGADAMNMETFGACSGWSYEEALQANAKIKLSREIEESTIGASSRQSQSQSEDNTDGSEDGRERPSYCAEASPAPDEWNWEVASMQAKVLDDQRQIWNSGGAIVQAIQE